MNNYKIITIKIIKVKDKMVFLHMKNAEKYFQMNNK